MPRTKPVEIGILALPESSASVVFGMYDLFLGAGREWGMIVEGTPGPDLMRPRVLARDAEGFATLNEVWVRPHATLEGAGALDVLCVPDVVVSPDTPVTGRFDREIALIRAQAERGAIIATACSGTVLLAETGLLDGEDATTHWAFCDALERRHPRVKVRRERALVIAGEGQRLVMAGGGTSWLDVALYVIARTVSVEIAMQVARVNLIDWHELGQQPFARLAPSRQTEDALIARCQLWAAEHYEERAPVAAMIELSGLPERTFKRRFARATGMSPLEYVHTIRIEEAKQALETTDAPLADIAREVGYDDPAHFARLFRSKVRLTAAQYRRRFGSLREVLRTGGARRSA